MFISYLVYFEEKEYFKIIKCHKKKIASKIEKIRLKGDILASNFNPMEIYCACTPMMMFKSILLWLGQRWCPHLQSKVGQAAVDHGGTKSTFSIERVPARNSSLWINLQHCTFFRNKAHNVTVLKKNLKNTSETKKVPFIIIKGDVHRIKRTWGRRKWR